MESRIFTFGHDQYEGQVWDCDENGDNIVPIRPSPMDWEALEHEARNIAAVENVDGITLEIDGTHVRVTFQKVRPF